MEPDGEQKKEVSADALDGAKEHVKEAAKEHVKESAKESIKEDTPAAGSKLLLSLKKLLHAIGGLFQRSKHILQGGVAKIIDAGRGLLQRLRKRTTEPGEGQAPDDERKAARPESQAKAKAREAHAKEVPPQEVAAPHPHSAVHSILLYLLVLIIGSVAGMTFSFLLFSTMVSNQAKKIDDQRDEISQLEKQHSRLLESEANYRKESNESRQRLSELEALEAARVAATAAQEAAANPTAANPATTARGKQPVARKTGNCTVDAGNIDQNLNRCIDEFNRK